MSTLTPVSEALDALFKLVTPLEVEEVALAECAMRVLAKDPVAKRNQPPFDASAMDGYAVKADDARIGTELTVIGEARAGFSWSGTLEAGQAVRIFTGAPMPDGAERVIIQEDVSRDNDKITLLETLGDADNIRPEGSDFAVGHRIIAPKRLRPGDIALCASMNLPSVHVYRRPEVAIIATGDELVQPGSEPNKDQIVSSNSYGLKAMFEAAGAIVRMLPIALDNVESLGQVLELARGADVIITIGGASVGDYDLVGEVAGSMGLEREFYKVAMRPGKPLMCGKLGNSLLVGLPGNPVSSMVCGQIFVVPALRAMQGLPPEPAPRQRGRLATDAGKNGDREHYMRAKLEIRDGAVWVHPESRQDSSLLSVLSWSNCLLVRAPHADPLPYGAEVEYIPL
ncbi:MAG: molybdopterin molybdotransferase MoeA [Dinoroseobacter sp.]|nr:molybdopterin molybdotransferase MoeA [Dinoroseobacter sp.]